MHPRSLPSPPPPRRTSPSTPPGEWDGVRGLVVARSPDRATHPTAGLLFAPDSPLQRRVPIKKNHPHRPPMAAPHPADAPPRKGLIICATDLIISATRLTFPATKNPPFLPNLLPINTLTTPPPANFKHAQNAPKHAPNPPQPCGISPPDPPCQKQNARLPQGQAGAAISNRMRTTSSPWESASSS